MLDCKQCQFKAGGDAGFFENIGEMSLYCFFAETELRCNIAIAEALYDATHHIQFARRQSGVFFSAREGWIVRVFRHVR